MLAPEGKVSVPASARSALMLGLGEATISRLFCSDALTVWSPVGAERAALAEVLAGDPIRHYQQAGRLSLSWASGHARGPARGAPVGRQAIVCELAGVRQPLRLLERQSARARELAESDRASKRRPARRQSSPPISAPRGTQEQRSERRWRSARLHR
jgi:hypothetical protein